MEVVSDMSSFYDSVKLDEMRIQTENEIKKLNGICQTIESSITSKSNKSSVVKRIGTIIGLIFWVIIYFIIISVVLVHSSEEIIDRLSLLFLFLAGIFVFIKIIDIIGEFSYYGNIRRLQAQLNSIKKKIDTSYQSLKATSDKIFESRQNGWNYVIEINDPIIGKMESLRSKTDSIKERNNKVLNKLLTVFYYLMSVVFTVFVSRSLYDLAYDLSSRCLSYFFSYTLSQHAADIILTIILVIACIGECFLATILYTATDEKITNVTLIGTLLGPVAFALLVAVVLLIVGLISLLIIIGILALAFACTCGG